MRLTYLHFIVLHRISENFAITVYIISILLLAFSSSKQQRSFTFAAVFAKLVSAMVMSGDSSSFFKKKIRRVGFLTLLAEDSGARPFQCNEEVPGVAAPKLIVGGLD